MDNYSPVPKVYGSDSMRDGVISPLAQTMVTGVLSGAALGSVLWLAGVESAWRWSLGVIPVVWLAVWLLSLSHWRSSLERLLSRDIDGDGYIGEPLPLPPVREPLEPVRVIVERSNPREVDYIDLPAKPEQLRQLADGLVTGRSFSLSSWTGAGAPFSRAEFERLRDELIRRGLAVWKNPHAQAQGVELSASGRAVLRKFTSEASSSPTLRGREPRA